MARRLLGLATIIAVTAQQTTTTTTFEQGAKREWRFTVETTCCVNKKAYKHDVDIPCNAAARRGVAGAALVALLGLLLCN